ncbi:MAG: NUDIX domain-containing protein [Gammaproteobacteria bacterium]|nr:NUDIX domain-containing protein [Gammaproteobacteria bacterium]
MAGRQRKFLSCGAVGVHESDSGPRVLMLRAFSAWDFPKGLVEGDEAPRDTAIRDVREETMLDDLSFLWGEDYFETGPYSRGKVARYYLDATRRQDVAILPNPETGQPEHSEYRWLSIADARRLAAPRVRLVIDWAETQIGDRR